MPKRDNGVEVKPKEAISLARRKTEGLKLYIIASFLSNHKDIEETMKTPWIL